MGENAMDDRASQLISNRRPSKLLLCAYAHEPGQHLPEGALSLDEFKAELDKLAANQPFYMQCVWVDEPARKQSASSEQ